MKRKILGIILFFCLVAPITATFTWLKVQKYRVKKEIKQNIKSNLTKQDLILIKISERDSKDELQWEHSKEFKYKEYMYDVVQTERHGDTLYYYCWLDHKETALNKKLDELIDLTLGQESDHKKTEKHLTIFFKSLYFSSTTRVQVSNNTLVIHITPYTFSNLSVAGSPPSPPPKLA